MLQYRQYLYKLVPIVRSRINLQSYLSVSGGRSQLTNFATIVSLILNQAPFSCNNKHIQKPKLQTIASRITRLKPRKKCGCTVRYTYLSSPQTIRYRRQCIFICNLDRTNTPLPLYQTLYNPIENYHKTISPSEPIHHSKFLNHVPRADTFASTCDQWGRPGYLLTYLGVICRFGVCV